MSLDVSQGVRRGVRQGAMPRAGRTVDRTVEVYRAGGVEYALGLAWQMEAAGRVRERREADGGNGGGESLALIQHQPVYTIGARGGRRHVLVPVEHLEALGAQVVDCDRGGDVTFHGPGQLVAYPILDLHARGLHAGDYVRALEGCVIRTLAAFGVSAGRIPGRPGVWASGAKVAAIGVRIERGVSRHGLALNVSTDLAWFDAIVPCGLPDAPVTSMQRLLGDAPPFEAVVEAFQEAFAEVFECELVDAEGVGPGEGGRALRRGSGQASTGSARTERVAGSVRAGSGAVSGEGRRGA